LTELLLLSDKHVDENPRSSWQALQSHLKAARTALDTGEPARALEQAEAALAIDPDFLAAHVLRERIQRLSVPDAPASQAGVAGVAAVSESPIPPPPVSAEGYARFEQRAKKRRLNRCIRTARAAIERRRLDEARAALEEIVELDSGLPELSELTAAVGRLRRARWSTRPGPHVVAAAVFAATMFGSWRHDPDPPLPRQASDSPPVLSSEPAAVTRVERETTSVASTPEPPVPLPETRPGLRQIRTGDASTATPRPVPDVSAFATDPAVMSPRAPSVAPYLPVQQPAVAAIAAPAAPLPATLPGVDDEVLVRQALQRYRRAYEGLDAESAQAVYPGVNQAALARAFEGLQSQSFAFDACDMQLRERSATATCRGSARYVPKIGVRAPHTEPRVWRFTLRKNDGDWTIDSARVEQ
jgi:hypothetical protein